MKKSVPLTGDSLLLERLELPGEEVVFLDDIGSNLSAARQAGIATIKVADVHTAIGELQVSFVVSYFKSKQNQTLLVIWTRIHGVLNCKIQMSLTFFYPFHL